MKQFRQSFRPLLNDVRSYPWHFSSYCPRSGIKLVHVKGREFVFFNEGNSFFEILFCFRWEAADDIGSDCKVWDIVQKEGYNVFELFAIVFAFHFEEDGVGCGLDGDVDEAVDVGVVEDVGDFLWKCNGWMSKKDSRV